MSSMEKIDGHYVIFCSAEEKKILDKKFAEIFASMNHHPDAIIAIGESEKIPWYEEDIKKARENFPTLGIDHFKVHEEPIIHEHRSVIPPGKYKVHHKKSKK